MESLIDVLTSPTTLLVIAFILGAMKAVGELLIKLGNMGSRAADKNDWFDSVGAFLMKSVDGLGKVLAFLAPGNRQK